MNRVSTRRINKIKRLREEGVTLSEIAKRVKVSMKTVSRYAFDTQTPVVKAKRKYTRRKGIKTIPNFTNTTDFRQMVACEVAKIVAEKITL